MSRLWVRILVFTGLMGAAGVIWGVAEAALFTRSFLRLPPDAPESNAAWALPVAFGIILFSLWLSLSVMTCSGWRAAGLLTPFHTTLMWALIPPAVSLVLMTSRNRPAVYGTVAGYALLMVILQTAEFIRIRKARKLHPGKPKQRVPKELMATAIAVSLGALLLVGYVVSKESEIGRLVALVSLNGFSLVLAWQLRMLDLVNFGRWLADAMIFGGGMGVLVGAFLSLDPERDSTPATVIRRAAIGLPIGAVISGLMFGAHAVLLLQTYRVAWNSDAMLAPSLCVWGILGAVGGLILAGAVHVMSAQSEQRIARLPTAAALTIPPVIFFSLWAWGFVCRHDAGRDLLAKAAKVSWHGMFISFHSDPEKDTARARGNTVVHVRAAAEAEESSGRYDYEHASRLCDEQLSRYPDSAYRSAALFLKYWSQTYNWEPQAALMTHAGLNARYPRHRYGAWAHSRPLLLNLMLTGDYEEVVRESRDFTRTLPRYRPYDAEAYAAEVLGLWDDVVRIHRAEITRLQAETKYKSKRYYKDLEKLQDKIKHAESMKAKGVGPRPRTDVEGRVLLAGKPFSGCKVCVVPAGFKHPVSAASTAALRGGLLGVTDGSGRYRISGVPSGEYEAVLVMDPEALPDGHAVQAPGVPYHVAGSSMRLPDIRLTPGP